MATSTLFCYDFFGTSCRKGASTHFERTLSAFKKRSPFRPFAVALVTRDRFEVDRPDALVMRDGVPVYVAAGGVPVLFDHGRVSQVIGDLMGQAVS